MGKHKKNAKGHKIPDLYIGIRAVCGFYLGISTILLLTGWVFVRPLYTAEGLTEGYLQGLICLFTVACVHLGIAVYSYRNYTGYYREFRFDSLFFLLNGIPLWLVSIVLVINSGTLTAIAAPGDNTYVNAVIILLSFMPLPVIIRALIVAVKCGKMPGGAVLIIAAGLLLSGWLTLAVTGQLMRTGSFTAAEANNMPVYEAENSYVYT
ncbi:MAG: hypothetical protein FWE80_05205 [Oscillospiraceae bacterium]|nr:hypothetical protein [Oscillospiraceae bacterium]